MSEHEREEETDRDERASEDQRSNLTRRQLVASGAATWATVGLAGCNYITDPGPEDQGDGGDDDSGDDTPTSTTTVTNETTTVANGTVTGDETTTEGGETTTEGGGTTTESGGGSCSISGQFLAGMDVAMNVDIFDRASGDHLGESDVDSVTVEFPHADFDPIELDWSGPHEEFRPDEWGGKLSTDEDTPAGTYQYEIVVEGDGIGGTERISDQFTIV